MNRPALTATHICASARLTRLSPCAPANPRGQVQAAARDYQHEFAAKDAAIQALNSEVEALQDLLHAQLQEARAAAKVRSSPPLGC